jgi:hypothetical protein
MSTIFESSLNKRYMYKCKIFSFSFQINFTQIYKKCKNFEQNQNILYEKSIQLKKVEKPHGNTKLRGK